MASFSFGAGNAAKLARMPLYAAGRMATLLIPRSRDRWVFGCATGIGDGALALWQAASGRGHRMLWLTASARDERDAAQRGIPTARKHSVGGFWATARARVVVVTHGFGDVNRYATGGGVIVQLWHGIPLKRIGIDSPETIRVPAALAHTPLAGLVRRLLALLYTRTTRAIDVIPASSHLVRGRLQSAFSLPDACVPVTGEPRTDVLSAGTAPTRRDAARAGLMRALGGLDPRKRLILYAPTWRDGEPDPAVPTPRQWQEIDTLLERRNALLLVRSHPLGAGVYAPPRGDRVRMLGSDIVPHITPLLPALDVLITDYSSIAYDAALVPVPTVYFAPDLDAYTARRGLYGTYADVAGDGWATDWPQALRRVDDILAHDAARERAARQAHELSVRVHAFSDGDNAARVYRAIHTAVVRTVRRRGIPGLLRGLGVLRDLRVRRDPHALVKEPK